MALRPGEIDKAVGTGGTAVGGETPAEKQARQLREFQESERTTPVKEPPPPPPDPETTGGGGTTGTGGGTSDGTPVASVTPETVATEILDETGQPLAIPRNARLASVASHFRVLWDTPDGQTVWYSINLDQLAQIYGSNWRDSIDERYSGTAAYDAKYGNLHWGNVAEISRTSEDPWEDMQDRIFSQFGFVAGMDDPEVRKLIMQAWFEGWDTNEFIAHYKDTGYFDSLADKAREWATLSDAEKAQRVEEQRFDLIDTYRLFYGTEPDGLALTSIDEAAFNIASGAATEDEFKYNTRIAAELIEDSPAHRNLIEEDQATGEREVTIENLGGFAEDEWRKWMGPAGLPDNFASSWGNDLFLNKKSEEDLEQYLTALAFSAWPNKPEQVSWTDWSASPKSSIRTILELPSVDDEDALLTRILTEGLVGADLTGAIRHDSRFLETQGFLDDTAIKAHAIGQTMGFIP